MNSEELDGELDKWLDRAMREYGQTEIGPGFERRIIENVTGGVRRRKWYFRRIPVAVAAVAALALSTSIFRTEFQGKRTRDIAAARPEVISVLEPELVNETLGTAAMPSAQRLSRRRQSSKPSGRFLSSGLSDQERCLIAFARAASELNIYGLSAERKFEPLQIPELQIPEFEITFETEAFRTPTTGSEVES